jgi:translation initiation factor RLI1
MTLDKQIHYLTNKFFIKPQKIKVEVKEHFKKSKETKIQEAFIQGNIFDTLKLDDTLDA